MVCLTGNLCYVVVTNVQVLSCLINNLKAHFQEYIFMSTEMYKTVHCMVKFHATKTCSMCYTGPKTYTSVKLSTKQELVLLETSISELHKSFIYQGKIGISFATCAHSRHPSLCQRMP